MNNKIIKQNDGTGQHTRAVKRNRSPPQIERRKKKNDFKWTFRDEMTEHFFTSFAFHRNASQMDFGFHHSDVIQFSCSPLVTL